MVPNRLPIVHAITKSLWIQNWDKVLFILSLQYAVCRIHNSKNERLHQRLKFLVRDIYFFSSLRFIMVVACKTDLIIYNPYCLFGIGQCSMSCEHATLSSKQYPIYTSTTITTEERITEKWTKVCTTVVAARCFKQSTKMISVENAIRTSKVATKQSMDCNRLP